MKSIDSRTKVCCGQDLEQGIMALQRFSAGEQNLTNSVRLCPMHNVDDLLHPQHVRVVKLIRGGAMFTMKRAPLGKADEMVRWSTAEADRAK